MSIMQTNTISVFGLGKLGSPLAVAFAHKGFQVIGVDISERFVEDLNRGLAPVEETGLQAMLDAHRDRLRATTDYQDAILNSQVSSIIVPTPTGPDGTFVLDYVMEAVKKIGQVLAQKESYHLIAIVSTVMPGDTEKLRIALDEASGKTCGPDFGLCYSPEFIALGSVLYNLLNPDMLLIGQSDDRAGDLYEAVLLKLTDNKPQVKRMNFVNAELTKISVNSYVTMKITYANMIARLCERLPEADANVVTEALGMDSRIGGKYLTGAVAFGGPCFPRDNVALMKVAERLDTTVPLAAATHHYNREQSRLLTDLVTRHVEPGAHVAVLGLAYKPDTPVVEESASLYLIRELVDLGFVVTAYDPMAMANARLELDSTVRYAETLEDAVSQADAVIIATAWKAFKIIDPGCLRRTENKVTIFDCWRILDVARYRDVARVIYLGTSEAHQPVSIF